MSGEGMEAVHLSSGIYWKEHKTLSKKKNGVRVLMMTLTLGNSLSFSSFSVQLE